MVYLSVGGYIGFGLLGLLFAIIVFIIKVYNVLVDLRNKVRNSSVGHKWIKNQ